MRQEPLSSLLCKHWSWSSEESALKWWGSNANPGRLALQSQWSTDYCCVAHWLLPAHLPKGLADFLFEASQEVPGRSLSQALILSPAWYLCPHYGTSSNFFLPSNFLLLTLVCGLGIESFLDSQMIVTPDYWQKGNF